ncbi:hypothetical protein TNCV_1976001 [Trichonephila clavipes]|nr:hypothetical protein TNCV_1976001 [Trichonephila clavipes]
MNLALLLKQVTIVSASQESQSGFVLQSANIVFVICRHNLLSLDCLRAVNAIPWPARSPDLSPIEHILDMAGFQSRVSQNFEDPQQQLVNSWQIISQDEIRNLYHSIETYKSMYHLQEQFHQLLI